jgi:hypothetical protein
MHTYIYTYLYLSQLFRICMYVCATYDAMSEAGYSCSDLAGLCNLADPLEGGE